MTEILYPEKSTKLYGYGLLALWLVFCFRVGAQLLQRFSPVSFLPDFEAWHSGALPYGLLVTLQILIIAFCFRIIFTFLKGTVHPETRSGKLYLIFGLTYFSIMLFRLGAGLTFAPDHPWLGARIPTIFHLVLASFLLVVGQFHFKFGKEADHEA